jgi:hypothetical protein
LPPQLLAVRLPLHALHPRRSRRRPRMASSWRIWPARILLFCLRWPWRHRRHAAITAVASPAIGAGAHSPAARFSNHNAPAALQCCALHRTAPRSAAHRPEHYAPLLFASLSRRRPRRSCRPGSAIPSPCQYQPPAGALFLRYQALSLTARFVRPCPQAPRRAPAWPIATAPLPAAGKCVRFVLCKAVP